MLLLNVIISLEDAYETLRVFEILSIEKKPIVTKDTCQKVLENLGSSSPLKDVFYALKVNGILKCNVGAAIFKVFILFFFHGHYCYKNLILTQYVDIITIHL